jgi:hypothetical protein
VNGQPFSISLPAGIQLPASLVGQFVTLNLRLAQAENAEDEDNDDQGEDEDDDHGHDQGHDDHGGHGDDGGG